MSGTDPGILTRPTGDYFAEWDEHRSIRLIVGRGTIGLATTAYSYKLTDDELRDSARRLAILWNLHIGVSTDELERQLSATEICVSFPGLEG